MACWHWCVRREHGFRGDVVFGGASLNAAFNEPSNPFDAAKRSMSFVEVPDSWHEPHCVCSMHNAHTEQHLLPKPKIRITTV